MSVAFVPKRHRGKAQINQETIQRLLDENDQLVRCITEYMQKGRAMECVQYQQILHRNIVYPGTIADASQTWLQPQTYVLSLNEIATSCIHCLTVVSIVC
uniref:SS18-like protein 2 n=1 Tax=Salmo salar TaxID=8030 RepID=B5XG39_SALSA|nr:SS18-like protein 2 [Salmo salar]